VSLVILIFGASGSGKSTLMEYLTRAGQQYSIHIKGTDRAKRNYDGIEIKYVNHVTDADYDYVYETYGYRYGIQRAQIDAAISARKEHFIICNDISVIRRIKADYGRRVKVIFHHFDAPRDALLNIQRLRNISDDEIELRLAKTEALYRAFVEQRKLFDGVLHNRYQKPEVMIREIEQLLSDMTDRHRAEGLSGKILHRVNKITRQLENQRVATATESIPHEPGYVFIVMPMNRALGGVPDTYAAILRACRAAKMRGSRIDDKSNSGLITQSLHTNIRLAEYVVADLTHERPNVYYEVGYAIALGKPILLVAKDDTKVHLDLQGYRAERYENYVELEKTLKKWLRDLAKASRQHSSVLQEPKKQKRR